MATTAVAASSASPHRPNDRYVSRLPTPPRSSLPSAGSWTEAVTWVIQPPLSLPFLQNLDWSDMLAFQKIPDWQYESRRQAQDILPFLYLGPSTVCRDIEFLRTAGIDMVVAVRHSNVHEAKPLSQSLKKAEEAGISFLKIDVLSSQELVAAFPISIATINRHLSNRAAGPHQTGSAPLKSSVFVCCDSGNSRSAAIVIAYCMEVLGLSVDRAMQLVHARRFCTSLDDSLKLVLSSYADILQARRDVSGMAARSIPMPAVTPGQQLCKRARDEEDEEMDDADDIERFQNRKFTPFQG